LSTTNACQQCKFRQLETVRSQTLLLVDLALFLLQFGNQAIDALPRLARPGLEPPKRGA
jgi:hypothetical protein